MKKFSTQEEQLLKESAEWFNRTITKVKARKDPYKKVIVELVDDLSDLIDDIDKSLYQLSRSNENVPNFEYSSSMIISTIKEKTQAFAYKIAFFAKELSQNKDIINYVSKENVPPATEDKEEPVITEQKNEEVRNEIEVIKPEVPKSPESFLSTDDMIDKIEYFISNLITFEYNMNEILSNTTKIINNMSSDPIIPIGDTSEPLSKRVTSIGREAAHLLEWKAFLLLKEELENIILRKRDIIKNKSLSQKKYLEIYKDYVRILNAEKAIVLKYTILYNYLKNIKDDTLEDISPPPEAATTPVPASSTEENSADEVLDLPDEEIVEALINKNIIIIKNAYCVDAFNQFLTKYATRPTTYEKFMTALNTMLMHVSSAFSSNKAERILDFRKSILKLKNGIKNIIVTIKNTTGEQNSPEQEIARWNTIIDSYNKFATMYNEMIHTEISSRLSSLNQDLFEQKALSITPQTMMSRNTFNTAINNAKRNYQPAKFVINKLPPMESLVMDASSGKIWGMKESKI